MALLMPKPPPNPMSEPPPPLPIKAIEDRKPSVLVYPIPQSRDNVPLQLAIALGETMNVRVGPTTIVGNVARIDVPNHKVELRALSLKRFTCVGQKVYIFKNDRIIDNPDLLVRRGGRGRGGGRGRDRGPPGDYGYRDEIGVDSRENWYPQQQTGPDDSAR
ncbi:hypothetical protein ADEAN_000501500 [Angomonas deanei]|uniref:Uncharacterized protein n=1 Tax=Angomonas deanei TaxID=59799 RepID=A0A7G2CEU5_9TRYP|nr:hypothetical protein ADEAN_000501500 [Angomonas deanei]